MDIFYKSTLRQVAKSAQKYYESRTVNGYNYSRGMVKYQRALARRLYIISMVERLDSSILWDYLF